MREIRYIGATLGSHDLYRVLEQILRGRIFLGNAIRRVGVSKRMVILSLAA